MANAAMRGGPLIQGRGKEDLALLLLSVLLFTTPLYFYAMHYSVVRNVASLRFSQQSQLTVEPAGWCGWYAGCIGRWAGIRRAGFFATEAPSAGSRQLL